MLNLTDTIAAIATAHGVGSIAIVRLSGSQSLEIASKIAFKAHFKPRYATLSSLYDIHNQLIDEAIVIYFQAPNSFTTEDVIEFQCHGGSVVANQVLSACIHYGARLSNPGEFTKRAFLGGRIDLAQAEAAAKLIDSKSVDAAHLLAKQLKGELSTFVESIRDQLTSMLAHSEVSIDYAEEDLPENLLNRILHDLQSLSQLLEQTYQASLRRQGMMEGFKLSIIGKPNVGKSSLLNRLLNMERAIVSDIAGTTRDTIEESLQIGTHIIRIVDTAGIRSAADTIEQVGIERSLKAIEDSEIILALFDSSSSLNDEDKKILQIMEEHQKEKYFIIVLTKTDLPTHLSESEFDTFPLIRTNPQSTLETLFKLLESHLNQTSNYDDLLLTSQRQIQAVHETFLSIEKALIPLETSEMELFSFHLNEAIKHISSITRPYENAELLDKMFSQFCLGK